MLKGNEQARNRRKVISEHHKKYFPTIKKDFEQIQGDIIAEGAMLGHYQSTISIFALKHWCKWSDTPTADDDEAFEQLDKVLDEIGGVV